MHDFAMRDQCSWRERILTSDAQRMHVYIRGHNDIDSHRGAIVYDISMNAQVHRGLLSQIPQSRSDSAGVSRSECANIANKGVGGIVQERSMVHPLNEPW
jgi:hypothetical protein